MARAKTGKKSPRRPAKKTRPAESPGAKPGSKGTGRVAYLVKKLPVWLERG
jgi:hypothetical protein